MDGLGDSALDGSKVAEQIRTRVPKYTRERRSIMIFGKHWLEVYIFITLLTGITTGHGYTEGHSMEFDCAAQAEAGGDYLYRYTRSVTVFA